MTETFDLLLKNGTAVLPGCTQDIDIAVKNGKIAGIGTYSDETTVQSIDCTHFHVLPGVIDTQVHFREPGNEHKENLETGMKAAAAGGVTAVF